MQKAKPRTIKQLEKEIDKTIKELNIVLYQLECLSRCFRDKETYTSNEIYEIIDEYKFKLNNNIVNYCNKLKQNIAYLESKKDKNNDN